MTVVAAASLFGSVVMTADCRGTYAAANGQRVMADDLQKIVQLSPHVVAGYAGDVLTAGQLLRGALARLREFQNDERDQRRLHPILLTQWLPGYLAHAY